MTRTPVRPILAVLLFGALAPVRARATEVTACGQVVDGSGVLSGDLDCSSSPDPAVVLQRMGSLDLGGFQLKSGGIAVSCEGNCRIMGPGTIRAAFEGVDGLGERCTVRVSNVTIVGQGDPLSTALAVSGCRLRLTNSSISGFPRATICNRARITDSTLTGITGTFSGVETGAGVLLTRSTISGFGYNGVFSRSAVLTDSSVAGNGAHPICGVLQACTDLNTVRPSRLHGTSTCGTSHDQLSGFPGTSWGVCSLD